MGLPWGRSKTAPRRPVWWFRRRGSVVCPAPQNGDRVCRSRGERSWTFTQPQAAKHGTAHRGDGTRTGRCPVLSDERTRHRTPTLESPCRGSKRPTPWRHKARQQLPWAGAGKVRGPLAKVRPGGTGSRGPGGGALRARLTCGRAARSRAPPREAGSQAPPVAQKKENKKRKIGRTYPAFLRESSSPPSAPTVGRDDGTRLNHQLRVPAPVASLGRCAARSAGGTKGT